MNKNERLKELIKELAVVHGKVILSSGKEADYYVDLRRVTLHHEAAPLIGQEMLQLFKDHDFADVEAVGGLTMGADPVATAIMHASAADGGTLDACVVRKAAKSYGMGRQVEGPGVKNRKVIALDDTSTTGGSVGQAIEALKNAGANVIAAAVIVDRDTGAKEKIEQEFGIPYLYLYSKQDLGLD